MQRLSNQERWKPWQGVLLEVLFVVMLITAGAFMQTKWGMFGLLGTELMFLATAIIITILHKTPLKEVFPIKKISVTDFFGIVFFSIGAILLNFVCLGISATIFPNELTEAIGLAEFIDSGLGFIPTFLIIAVSPAICEESIMRGVLLSHFRGLKKDWVIALIVGASFGLLHVSLLRFLSTACIGALMAYVMTKKNNILLPALMHFINNALSAIVSSFSNVDPATSSAALDSIQPGQLLGTYLIIGFAAPIFIVLGALLLKLNKIKWQAWLVASILSVVMVVTGGILLFSTALNRESVVNVTCTCAMSEEKDVYGIPFEIEEDGNYQFVFVGTIPKGNVKYEILSEKDGSSIISGDGSTMIVGSEFVDFEPGNYVLYMTGDEDTYGSDLAVQFQLLKNPDYAKGMSLNEQ